MHFFCSKSIATSAVGGWKCFCRLLLGKFYLCLSYLQPNFGQLFCQNLRIWDFIVDDNLKHIPVMYELSKTTFLESAQPDKRVLLGKKGNDRP